MPRLITDPQEGTDYYLVELDGQATTVDAVKDPATGRARLEYDITDIAMGEHTARVAAGGPWGEGDWSDPFVFTKELPGIPVGLRLEF